jgi:hypothetical protein
MVELSFVSSTFPNIQCQPNLLNSPSRNSELADRLSMKLRIDNRRRRRRTDYLRRRLSCWLRRKRFGDERRRQSRGGRRRRNRRRGLRRLKRSTKDKRSWNRQG